MIQRMLASAVIAGFVVGLLAALLHFAFIQKLILLGEQYESGALVHFENAAKPAETGHNHDATANGEVVPAENTMADPDHEPATIVPSDFKRNVLTVLFTALIYVSYAMLLTAGFGLAESFGIKISSTQGVLWGIGGFIAFQMAPAMGLAPELPGTIAAGLDERQIWWWLTVLCTVTGLGLLAYTRQIWAYALAGALLAAPHVIGAPQPDAYWGVAPPELSAAFTARVLGVGLVVWAMLGWLAAYVWNRDGKLL